MRLFKKLTLLACIILGISSCAKDSGGSPDISSTATNTGVGGSLARFAVTNHFLYTVTDNGMNLFDIANAPVPIEKPSIYLGFGIETIFPKGNLLFIGTQLGMKIYDVSDRGAPKKLSDYQHIRSCDPVVADDTYAYVTLRSGNTCARGVNELQIVNIQDLTKPKFVIAYPMKKPEGLAVDGNKLFICDGSIKYYDISDVNSIVLKKVIAVEAHDVIARNGTLMAIGKTGLYQYDYSNGEMNLLSSIAIGQ